MYRQITWRGFLLLALAAVSASAVPQPQFVRQWGAFGTGDGEFNEPYAVAMDALGNVYVSDTVNYRIQKFDADGNFILKWGTFGFGPGEFFDPVGLTVDANGDVYVAEFSNDRVQKFDADGNFLYMWGSTGSGPGQFRTADAVCVDADFEVFVVDKNNHRVQKFENDGTFIRLWGGFGTGPGQFKYPVGIAGDASGNVYVAEQGGHRIQKFDNDGNFLTMWGSLGSAPGEFNEPIHIDIDASDRVFVPDSKNHRIQVFDSSGNFIVAWGTQGTGPGEFNEPEGVAVDGGDIVYVSDTQNHRIQEFAFIAACSPCPPLPPPDTAQFEIGDPVALGGNAFAVPLLVHTAASITFSQMTIEYDDTCLSLTGATVGAGVVNPGSIFISDDSGATHPLLNHHVLVNVTGEYGPGCAIEAFLLQFQSLVGPSVPCALAWDRSTPAGNPPNHLNTAGSVQIRFPAITFCDRPGVDLRTTIFRYGDPVPAGGSLDVPLLVTTDAAITFSQMTAEYAGTCLVLEGVAIGAGVANPGSPFVNDAAGATDPLLDRHVLVNVTGQYGPGTDIEVFRLRFRFAPGAQSPCRLAWDETPSPGNPPNHLITSVPSQIPPQWIQFIDGAVSSTCPDIEISGAVRYSESGNPILPVVPDPTSAAVTVEDCADGVPSTTAGDGTYTLGFGPGPIAQVCLCAHRPKADCNGFEGGVISGNDLIELQDFVAQIGPPPTPRQLLRADLNRDGVLLGNDVLGLKQWIAHAAVCSGNTCLGLPTDNCAGTWRFVYPTGPGPNDFEVDSLCLDNVCSSQTVDVEGMLLGDVDASWPNIFPLSSVSGGTAKAAPAQLAFRVLGWEGDEVTLALRADLAAGAVLHHVVLSLDYDGEVFAYRGMRVGAGNMEWGYFENPAQHGVVHGILHRLAGMDPVTRSGEIALFRFRALGARRSGSFAFGRLRANDVDVPGVTAEVDGGRQTGGRVPAVYQLGVYPNPFNPTTRVRLAIPDGAGAVPVALRVYDIAGRLARTLLDEIRDAGIHEVVWNGADDRGRMLGAGIYVVRAQAGDWSEVRRVALVK
jgi:streptogramin lyase